MIVKCISDRYDKVPEEYLSLGPDRFSDEKIALFPGKYYAVYAVRQDSDTPAEWYFVYTDNGYLWWMPATAFEVTEDNRPEGWTDESAPGKDIVSSYPSLHDWKIEEGIIDNDDGAEPTFLAEVQADPTFPSKERVDELNYEFEKQQKISKYNEELKIAKENGWERPEKPVGLE